LVLVLRSHKTLAARPRPRPRLGLQEQDQTNTEAARPRPKQDHHCKTLARILLPNLVDIKIIKNFL